MPEGESQKNRNNKSSGAGRREIGEDKRKKGW